MLFLTEFHRIDMILPTRKLSKKMTLIGSQTLLAHSETVCFFLYLIQYVHKEGTTEMAIDTKLCGSRIRAVRKSRNMTAYRLAETIGLSEVSLTHIECGSRGPSLQTISAIADALDTSIDYLIGRVNKPEDIIPAPMIEEQGLTDKQVQMLKDIAKAVTPIIKKNT